MWTGRFSWSNHETRELAHPKWWLFILNKGTQLQIKKNIQQEQQIWRKESNLALIYFCLGLFGEGPADRRERLRQLLAQIGEDTVKKKKIEQAEQKKKKEEVCLLVFLFLFFFFFKYRIGQKTNSQNKKFIKTM